MRRTRAGLSWLAFTVLMSAAFGVGIGFLGAAELVARPPVVAASTWNLSDRPSTAETSLSAIEIEALPPMSGHAGAAHAPHNIAARDWLALDSRGLIHATWRAASPVTPGSPEPVVTASEVWDWDYNEGLESQEEADREILLPPEPDPVLPGHGLSPVIAIVIDDLGLNRRQTAAVMALPGPLTLAFIPYAEDLANQTGAAQAQGHEIFLHLPMEPIDPAKNPGPNALLTSLTPDELAMRLAENLDRFSGYVGVNNHMGSRLTQDAGAMAIVMAELKRRNLLFLDSLTIGNSVANLTAQRLGVPSARRDIFLDNDPEVAAILAQLSALEAVASRRGFAIAIGHPYSATVAALTQWMPGALARGYRIVPASEIIDPSKLTIAQHAASNQQP